MIIANKLRDVRKARRKVPGQNLSPRLRRDVTVCIAAICENGRKIVTACDSRLSLAGIASDAFAGKMLWMHDWLFQYAGVPDQINLIFEEMRFGNKFDRVSLHDEVSAAYRRAKAKFCAHAVLSPYDLTMDEFKKEGLKIFGSDIFGQLSDAIQRQGEYFNEHLLVSGFGDAENAAHLFKISNDPSSPTLTGIAAIGSGAEIAISTLLNLGHARHSTLGDTLYEVAAAKFSAEMTEDRSVGTRTTMYVAWRKKEGDPSDKPPGEFITDEEIGDLRLAWEEYGKPRNPEAAAPLLWEIVKRVKGVGPGVGTPMEVGDFALSLKAHAHLHRIGGPENPMPLGSQTSEDQQ
jgi:hypothetical protein